MPNGVKFGNGVSLLGPVPEFSASFGSRDEHFLPSQSSIPTLSGYGAQYDQMFANNPYANLEYRESGWQKFLKSLGFRTGADTFREQQLINFNEWNADVFALMQQNEFNSPEQQAARMRAAGLNPDLQGLGDVAQGADMRNDANGMPVQDSTDFGEFGSMVAGVAQFAFQSLTSVFSMMKDMKALKNLDLTNQGLALQNEGQSVANGQSLTDLVTGLVWQTTSPDQVPDPTKLNGSLEIALGQIFTDVKQRKAASGLAKEIAAGLPQDARAWKEWHERAKSKVGYASIAGSEGFDEQVSDAMMSYYGFVTDLQIACQQALYSVDISNANEQIDYNDALDSTLAGEATNEQNEAAKQQAIRQAQQAAMAHAIDSTFEKWLKKLEEKANGHDRGHGWASIALALIGLTRMIVTSGISFGSSRGAMFNPQSGARSSSSGFNLGF